MLRYLLGELKPAEKERFEESYFADDSVYAALCGAEDELIVSYLRGRLSWRVKRRFEKYYLASPTRVAKVEEDRRLMRAVSPGSADRLRFWAALASFLQAQSRVAQLGPLVASLVVVLCGVWLVERAFRLQRQVDQAFETLRRNQIGGLAAASPAMPNDGLATIILRSGMLKGEGGAPGRMTIPAAAEAVRAGLVVSPATGYRDYRASLHTPEGGELWRQTGLKERRIGVRDVVVLILPTEILTGTDYIIQLEGSDNGGRTFEPLGSYWLGVVKL
jgi:anti-sigma factor RsiW